ncbi:MAG: MFS transporter [Mobilitalea sp.]
MKSKSTKSISLLVLLLSTFCGIIVANLYYAQPLVRMISSDIGISSSTAGFIVTLTQLGYAAGLLFLVPLSDLFENLKLVSIILILAVLGLITAAFSTNAFVFLLAAFVIGVGAVATQILVPYSSFLFPAEQRGQMVGKVMSGVLLGIMLARPVSSLVADMWGWRSIFIISAVITGSLVFLLKRLFPLRKPISEETYPTMIKSLWYHICHTTVLRRRALYQACLFGSFSLFWTVVPMWLTQHYHFTQRGVAVFALVGVTGAVAAPIAGRLADLGWSKVITGIAFIIASLAYASTLLFENNQTISLVILMIAAILLDMCVSGNLVLGQQAIYTLGDKIRGRVNGLFMAVFFIGGAVGSSVGGLAYANGGWKAAVAIGLTLPLLAFIYYLTEGKPVTQLTPEKNISKL